MLPLETVADIIRETAAAEILPLFGRLAAGDISEKGPGDLVTIADLAAERRLTERLEAAVPGSVTLGEEGVAADRRRLDLLAGAAPVWIIDPIDGTNNFAKGHPGFSVIVAYAERNRVLGGWIYDPLGKIMVAAARGGGVWSEGKQLRLGAEQPAAPLVGAVYGRTAAGIRADRALTISGRITGVRNFGSSGLEYIDLARGGSQFSLHSRSLPWDHAAGMMIVEEAGGVARFLDGTAYDPRVIDRAPLAAATEPVWRMVQAVATTALA